jgi:hypothetical protein
MLGFGVGVGATTVDGSTVDVAAESPTEFGSDDGDKFAGELVLTSSVEAGSTSDLEILTVSEELQPISNTNTKLMSDICFFIST